MDGSVEEWVLLGYGSIKGCGSGEWRGRGFFIRLDWLVLGCLWEICIG